MNIITAYHPATNKFNHPRKIEKDALGKLVVGLAVEEIKRTQSQIELVSGQITSSRATMRTLNKDIVQLKNELKTQRKRNPDTMLKEMIEEIEQSELIRRGLIQDLRMVGKTLYATTDELFFYPITHLDMGRKAMKRRPVIRKKTSIGRFLIRIKNVPSAMTTHYLSSIEIVNIMYRVQDDPHDERSYYSHPCIGRTKVCWGNASTKMTELMKKGDLVGALGWIVDFLVSPEHSDGFLTWKRYFKERKPLNKCIIRGRPYVIWRDGTESEPFSKRAGVRPKKGGTGAPTAWITQVSTDPLTWEIVRES